MEELCLVEELKLSRWLSHTSCTESHVGSVCCRHRVVHSSDHQCGQGAAFGHERWHPRCSHIRIPFLCAHGYFLQHNFCLLYQKKLISSLLVTEKLASSVKISRDDSTYVHHDMPLPTSSWSPYFPLWDKVLMQGFLLLICVLVDMVWQFGVVVVAVFAGIKNGSSPCTWPISSSCSWDVFFYLPEPFFFFTVPSSWNFAFNRYNVVLLTTNVWNLKGTYPSCKMSHKSGSVFQCQLRYDVFENGLLSIRLQWFVTVGRVVIALVRGNTTCILFVFESAW